MAVEYRFRLDEAYLTTAWARFLSQNRGDRWFLLVRWLCILVLGGFVAVLTSDREFAGAGPLAVFLVLLVVSRPLDRWIRLRRFRKTARFGDEAVIELSDQGIHARDSASEARLDWRLVKSARRFPDGWLFIEDPGQFRWLPDAATRSTPSEIESLLRAALAERVVA